MQSLDQKAIRQYKIPALILMENAGRAVAREAAGMIRRLKPGYISILCGRGNNGGDGYVVARKIHSAGGEVKVFVLGDKHKIRGAAKINYDIITKMSIEIRDVVLMEDIKSDILHCDVIVDAIFGTGLEREVSGIYRDVIDLVNEAGKKVCSLDIPSGVNGDTGMVMGVAVKSDYTISYGLPKIGNMLYPGFDLCGKLYVTHISFPPSLYEANSIKVHVHDIVKLPQRGGDTHKGSYGKAMFISGSSSYMGAPYFAALSFLKAGGGLSYLATPKSVAQCLVNKSSETGKGSEIVFLPKQETDSGSLSLQSKDELLEFSSGVDMVILGPGTSLDSETQELVRELAKQIEVPLLVDGDGITAVSTEIGLIGARKAPTILTPHSGEMSRLCGIDVAEINSDRIGLLQKTSRELNAIIVLKGAHSLTGYPDGTVYINTSGNPGMATAGSGDSLTGTIAAMHGLGLPVGDAVRTGVFMHGLSGDLAAIDKGEDGLTAQDIVDYLPNAMKYYRGNFEEISASYYRSIYSI